MNWILPLPCFGQALHELALAAPRTALTFIPHLLPPKTMEVCAEKEPQVAIMHAAQWLSPESWKKCIRAAPHTALACQINLLTLEELDLCIQIISSKSKERRK